MKRFIVSVFALMLTLIVALPSFSLSFAEEAAIIIDFSEVFETLSETFGDISEYSQETLTELQPNISAVSADIFLAFCAIEGDTIAFDGYINSNQKDLIICPGDFNDTNNSSWGFVIEENIDYQELDLIYGEPVSVIANIIGRNDDNMIVLEKAQIKRRDAEVPSSSAVEKTFEEALSEMLELHSSFDPGVEQFAKDYYGYTLELDGFIYECDENWPNDENYDLIICNGDFENIPEYYKYFKFENVSAQDFGFSGTDFPSYVEYPSNVHIVAKIIGFDDDLHDYILLDPISIEHRNPFTEGISDTSMYIELMKGSKGDTVKTLQQRLVDLKYLSGKVDGQYGNQTKAAIEKFQSSCNLEVTGVADPMTQAVLFSSNAPEAALTISCSSMVVGSSGKTVWYVDGQEFTLTGNKTKTITTVWGTYKFDAYGEYEKID